MDYPQVITPGAKCTNCDNHGTIITTSVCPLVRCTLYGQVNENDQAEHCINYYVPKEKREG
jgi:hypothetical protein